MKKFAFAALALTLSIRAATAASLEGTYSGTVQQQGGSDFQQTYVISEVTSKSATVTGTTHQGNGTVTARRDGNRLTFGKQTIRTLTINGHTAILTGRNTKKGSTMQGTLTKQ